MSSPADMTAESPVIYTIAQYENLANLGAFDGLYRTRVELINGEIVTMSPIGLEHIAIVNWLTEWSFSRGPKDRILVSVQNPIRLSSTGSEPEPDIVWSARNERFAHPQPSEILLVIEVAGSSLKFDRTTKLAVYAKAGIQDYWIVNLVDKQVEVYRDPQGNDYTSKTVYTADGQSPCPLAHTDAQLDVAAMFAAI